MEISERDEMPGMGDMNMVVRAMKEPQRTGLDILLPSSFVQLLREGGELTIMMENFRGMEG